MDDPTQARKYPPSTFCLIPKPFRPDAEVIPTPGLQEAVEELVRQGKLRSGMDTILAVLDQDPENQEALRLAMVIFGAVGRTRQINAEEALTPRYWHDSRLDSIFAVCSRCRVTSWVPEECLLGYQQWAGNPATLQCQDCGYVLCRKCLEAVVGEASDRRIACPNCGHFTLNKPAYPTGRLTGQLKRFGRPVQIVVVIREGPVPPSLQEVEKLLERFNPDPLSADRDIVPLPAGQWTDEVGAAGFFQLDQFIRARQVVPDTFEKDGEIVTDDDGLRVAIFRASAVLPSPDPLATRLSALKAELDAQPPSAAGFLQRLILQHMESVAAKNHPDPGYDLSAPLWARLISSPALDITTNLMLETVRQANESSQHACRATSLDKLVLVVSAVPAIEPAAMRTYFPGGYFGFLQANNLLAQAPENDFAHWIVCVQRDQFVIHLNILPLDHRAILIYARDLFSEAERLALNI